MYAFARNSTMVVLSRFLIGAAAGVQVHFRRGDNLQRLKGFALKAKACIRP
jgi:hypothetical protein